jgi:hypothetical protein
MPLFVKVIPVRAGTSEPAGEPFLLRCPPDVGPDTIVSFLTQRLGDPVELVRMSTERRERLAIGWVFPDTPAIGPPDAVEFACVPVIESSGGALQPVFAIPAGQRRQAAQRADSHEQGATVIRQPHRAHHPAPGPGGQRAGLPDVQPAGPVAELDQALVAIARQAGATLHTYPQPGPAARRVILRDERDDRGTRYLDAVVEHDGSLRITGHDRGPRVSDFWGEAITCYDWVYVIAPDRIPALLRVLGGRDGDDVLAFVAAYHQRADGQLDDFMTHPEVAAEFSNWHS